MAAVQIPLSIEQGTTFTHTLTWLQPDGVTPINLTGASIKSQWRASIDDPTVLQELSTENGLILVEPTLGKIKIHLPATLTATFTFTSGIYDLEVYMAAVNGEVPVYRLAKGKIKVSKECTK